jgi:MFS family permease
MGIGLVDPILPTLAKDLDASKSQVSLLFTSYFAMTGLAMLISGWVSSRIGARRTLLTGLVLVVIFAALAGSSDTVAQIVGFRLGWGLGNALFIATALSVIVGAASGGLAGAIVLYEAALGLGIASGPLLGGTLGHISWRGPFFGTALLMAIGVILIVTLLDPTPKPARKLPFTAPLRALGDRGLLSMGIVAALYNFGFFTLLAYTPFPLGLGSYGIGAIFFGWGLFLALTSVFAAQPLERRFGIVRTLGTFLALFALVMLAAGLFVHHQAVLAALVVVSGGLLGVINTVLTEGVMASAKVERPIASSAYSFIRFTGGAVAPFVAGKLGEHVSDTAPFLLGAALVALSVVALVLARGVIGHRAPEAESAVSGAALPAGAVLATVGTNGTSAGVLGRAAQVAQRRGAPLEVLHVRESWITPEGAADIEDEEAARAALETVLGNLRDRELPVYGALLHSVGHHADAAEAVIDHARRHEAAVIVVGAPSHGPHEPGQRSLAVELAGRADRDVLVVR